MNNVHGIKCSRNNANVCNAEAWHYLGHRWWKKDVILSILTMSHTCRWHTWPIYGTRNWQKILEEFLKPKISDGIPAPTLKPFLEVFGELIFFKCFNFDRLSHPDSILEFEAASNRKVASSQVRRPRGVNASGRPTQHMHFRGLPRSSSSCLKFTFLW